MARLVVFNKPFGVLSQFTDADERPTLAKYVPIKGVYPAGRLDHDSEGLLLLTDCGNLQNQISHPRHKLPKTYWAQVEGAVTEEALAALRNGVALKDGPTAPARARSMSEPKLWPRVPPVRERRNIPTSWIELEIREGRNRQVRRMTAAVGFPTLRLIRVAIGSWRLEDLGVGEFRVEEIYSPSARKTGKSVTSKPRFQRRPRR